MTPRFPRRSYFEALRLIGADRRALRRHASLNHLLVLNAHSVSPHSNPYAPSLHPHHLEALVRWLTRRATIVLLRDLPGSADRPPESPLVVLSFDDGLADFREHAMPVLERLGVPVNLNVIGGPMETGKPPWAIHLMDLLGASRTEDIQRLRVPGFGQTLTADDRLSKEQFGAALANHFKRLAPNERESAWAALRAVLDESAIRRPTRMMTADDVAAAHRAGHEIGSHSFSHESMEHLDDDAFLADFRRSRAALERAGCDECAVYAFPNGSHRSGQAELLHREGIRHVLLVDERPSDPGASLHPRLTLRGHSPAELRVRAASVGGIHA